MLLYSDVLIRIRAKEVDQRQDATHVPGPVALVKSHGCSLSQPILSAFDLAFSQSFQRAWPNRSFPLLWCLAQNQ